MNYVLFYPDEMRAQSLACYGNPVVRTPNMDAIAEEGTLFEENYTPHPVCCASRCSLVTGWYPHIHGHRSLWYNVDEREPNFIRYLRQSGYRTGLFFKNHVFTPEAMAESFDEVYSPERQNLSGVAGPAPGTMNEATHTHPYLMMPGPSPDANMETIMDNQGVAAGIDFMKTNAKEGQPFFAFFSLFYPHPPYTAPESYYNMYDPEEAKILDKSWTEGKPSLYRTMLDYKLEKDQDPAIYRKMQAVYLGMVTYTDMLLGRVVNALKEAGIYDNTTIIICSDHGDYAGDAHLVEKWPSGMDDMLTKVPLIIRTPGGKAGHRVKTPVTSIDIFPTICDLAGVEVQHDQFGVSLKDQLFGASGDEDRVVYCEGGYDVREPHSFEGYPGRKRIGMYQYKAKRDQQQEAPETVCRTVMRRDKTYKFVFRTNGENELYDMKKDPQEWHNLYNDPACQDLVSELKEKLLLWSVAEADVVDRAGHS